VAILSLLALPRVAEAQPLRFANVPWATAADSVRPRMEALGFRHVRTFETGDLRFRSDGDVVVQAGMAAGRLVNVVELRPAGTEALGSRYSAVLDSMKRVYGAPVEEEAGSAMWQRGFTFLEVHADSAQGDLPAAIRFWYRGPGSDAEGARRVGTPETFAALDSAWTVLVSVPEGRFALETATISRRPDGSYRTRVRVDYAAVREDPSGSYDTIIYGYDVDCPGNRLQMRSRTVLRKGRQVRSDQGATRWEPTREGTFQRELVRLMCEYVRTR
jgi:hypothetical protein